MASKADVIKIVSRAMWLQLQTEQNLADELIQCGLNCYSRHLFCIVFYLVVSLKGPTIPVHALQNILFSMVSESIYRNQIRDELLNT